MLDPDFNIERPKRYYRQGLSLLHPDSLSDEKAENDGDNRRMSVNTDTEHMSLMGSIRGHFSQVLHFGNHTRARTTSNVGRQDDHDDDASSISSRSSVSSRVTTPMLDPSTHVNPLVPVEDENMGEEHPWSNNKKKKKENVHEVSKHTFFITNSQMRWKLFARNQVCGNDMLFGLLFIPFTQRQMLQWITALEKAAAASHYTGSNRFESFAPIRLNVATQWLVDGVCASIALAVQTTFLVVCIAGLLLESLSSYPHGERKHIHT